MGVNGSHSLFRHAASRTHGSSGALEHGSHHQSLVSRDLRVGQKLLSEDHIRDGDGTVQAFQCNPPGPSPGDVT